jgi:uncharacterized cofD-like protein
MTTPRIVCLGGGTGLSVVLRGLKGLGVQPTAIVTLTDDGGSSGRLRRDLGMPPPGDVRNCLVALADDESVLAEVFQHRFDRGDLEGHSLGNLVLAALTEVAGSFEAAVALSSHVLAINGSVLPATREKAVLVAEMEDGRVVAGETAVASERRAVRRLRLQPEAPAAQPEALMAIAEADLIVLGPGSLFTSTIPPLLVPDLRAAVLEARCRRVYVANLLQEPHETIGYDAAGHVERLFQHVGTGIVDTILIPTARHVPAPDLIPVDFEPGRLDALGVEVVRKRMTDGHHHDPGRLARALVGLARRPATVRR